MSSGREDQTGTPGRPGSGRPGLQPTNPGNLIVAAVLTAGLAWLGMSRFWTAVPDITWLPGLTLAALAVVEALAAHNTRARIEQRPRRGAVNPLLVARYAVLAKASSLGGAIFAGAYGGVASWALSERDDLTVARTDLVPALAGLVGALALVAAALLLERACRVPDPPEDSDADGTGNAPTARR